MKSLSSIFVLSVLLLAHSATAQVNTASSVFTISLTYLGAMYDNGPDDATPDVQLWAAEPYVNLATGTSSSGFTYNGSPADFSESDIFLRPNYDEPDTMDTVTVDLSASAAAGPGEFNGSSHNVLFEIYGDHSADYDTYDSITLIFDYEWEWNWSAQEHPSTGGTTTDFLRAGAQWTDYNAVDSAYPNFVVVDDIGPDEDGYYVGIGESLADGTVYAFTETGTGQLQFDFPLSADAYDLNLFFDFEVGAEADGGLAAIPEPAAIWLAASLSVIGFLRRRR